MVEHLVLYKIHENTSESSKEAILELLRGLASIEGIEQFSVGLNHSQEGKSKGFEVGMRICFRDQASLDAYLPSEQHQSIVRQVRVHVSDVIVLDYTW